MLMTVHTRAAARVDARASANARGRRADAGGGVHGVGDADESAPAGISTLAIAQRLFATAAAAITRSDSADLDSQRS